MMTEETPVKVMSLLGVSLFSLAFMFAISASDASFSRANALPQAPTPENVVAMLDSTASSYGNFVHSYITGPASESLAFYGQSYHEGLAFVMDNADTKIVAMAGLSSLVPDYSKPQTASAGSVAGAFTMHWSQ